MSLLVDGLDQIWNYVEIDGHNPQLRAVVTTLAGVFGLLYATLLAVDGYWFPVFVTAGFLLGSLSTNRRLPPEPRLFQTSPLQSEIIQEESAESQQLSLFYPPLTEAVDKLITYFHRDYVLSWWNPLNLHSVPTFEQTVRARLNGGVHNIEKILIKQERNDLVMATVYGVANVLIIHMRECRSLESSGLTLDNYIYQNPQSPFAQLFSAKEQHQQMQALSAVILKRILPSSDTNSAVVMNLLTELLATYLFESILATVSDPDYINCWIVDYLSEKPDEPNGEEQENSKEIDGLYSVVERAAESLMAAKSDETETKSSTPQPTSQTPLQREPSPPPVAESQNGSSQQRSKNNEHTMHKLSKMDSVASDDSLPPIPESRRSSVQSSPGPRKKVSAPKAEDAWNQTPMIYANGTVNFSVMDISGGHADGIPQDKSKLMYIVQIERPAMEDQAGSEGGGYVITRTYADFEVFHAIISARHAKRVARINLRLPLDPIRSWLKLGGNSNPPPTATDPESICRSLERYLFTVVQDSELGRDQIILAFLRKERRSPAGDNSTDTVDVSFADEYMDEVSAYAAISNASGAGVPGVSQSSVGKAMSMLARAPSLAVKSVSNGANSLLGNDGSSGDYFLVSSPTQEPARRWFGRKTMREGSISSIRSGSTATSGGIPEDTEEEEEVVEASSRIAPDSITPAPAPPLAAATQSVEKEEEERVHGNSKPLTALDVELLIETTFALVVEIFDLTTANNRAWMRRTLLNLLREIVRRSYTEIIAEQYSSYIQDYLSPDALVELTDKLTQKYWPNGELAQGGQERTPEEKEATREQARKLLIKSGVPSGVRQLIGEQNCVAAMERLWARCQDQSLNRVLLVQLLERVMRPIFG